MDAGSATPSIQNDTEHADAHKPVKDKVVSGSEALERP